MAEGRLAPAPFETQEQYVSAPSSADFYLPLHQKPIDIKNGLVDPNALLEYMNGCHCEHVYAPDAIRKHEIEYHHVYFPKKHFKDMSVPLPIKQLRNSKYSLAEMVSCQEDAYHQSVSTEVPLEGIDPESANAFLMEDGVLTSYAATSWLIAETTDVLEKSQNLTRMAKALLTARLAILQEMHQRELSMVNQLEFIEPAIVFGALSRYLKQKPEEGLSNTVNQFSSSGIKGIPTKIYEEKTLRHTAHKKLNNDVASQSWVVKKIFSRYTPEVAAA
jgi:hypothetical protein